VGKLLLPERENSRVPIQVAMVQNNKLSSSNNNNNNNKNKNNLKKLQLLVVGIKK